MNVPCMYKKLCAWLKFDMVTNTLIKTLRLLSIIRSCGTKRTFTYHLLPQQHLELLLVNGTCIHELRVCLNFFIWQTSFYQQLYMSTYALYPWSYCSLSKYLWYNPFSWRLVAYTGLQKAAAGMRAVGCERER